MINLVDRVAVVTGGGRGIGAAVASLFVELGATVVIGDVDDEEGTALAATLGHGTRYEHLDVTSAAEWDSVVTSVRATNGRIDVLVQSAGIYARNALVELDTALMQRLIDVHLVGTILGMHAVIESMRERGGSIVNISSGAGIRGLATNTAYTAAKFGVRGATHAAALELAPMGIRVNSVHPGPVNTTLLADAVRNDPEWARENIPLGRVAEPREIAAMVAFLASPLSSYSTGAEFIVDGGHTA